MEYRISEYNLTAKTQITKIETLQTNSLGKLKLSKINTTDLIQNFPCQRAKDEKKNMLMSKYSFLWKVTQHLLI